MIFADKVVQLRKKSGWSQEELAEKLHVKKTSLASWEQGKSLPDIDTLFALCKILNIDLASISGFEVDTPPSSECTFKTAVEQLNAMSNYSAQVGSELAVSLSADETQLITDYRSLNEQGQEYIRQTMYMAKQTHKKMPDLSDMERPS